MMKGSLEEGLPGQIGEVVLFLVMKDASAEEMEVKVVKERMICREYQEAVFSWKMTRYLAGLAMVCCGLAAEVNLGIATYR